MPLLSIIIPTYNGSKTLGRLVNNLIQVFKKIKIEIIIINDYSKDNTDIICRKLNKKFPKIISYLKLSKNYGEHNAVMAGLKHSKGSLAIIMDDDNQNTAKEAYKLYNYSIKKNYDVVYTKYIEKKDSLLRKFMSKIANYSAELLINKPSGVYLSSFKSIKRKLINNIVSYSGPFPYIDGLILSKTNSIGTCLVKHESRKYGRSNYSLLKLLKLYSNLIINFSTVPIHIFSMIGILLTFFSVILIIITIVEKMTLPNVPLGYSMLITILLFFSGVQFLFLGLLGEYIGKILKNVNKDDQYLVSNIIKKK